jgi:cyanoexosortase B-associated protein
MLLSVARSWHLSRAKIVLLILLTVLTLVGAVPHYITQKWPWKMPPAVANLNQVRTIRQQGIPLQTWQTKTGQAIMLGNQHWYLQNLVQGKQAATLFLMPQPGPTAQPQVEWNDLEGIQRWQSDSYQTLKLSIPNPQQQFKAHFFRAWTREHTYAVVQWYAQTNGGSPYPSQWYIADRLAQWRHARIPWVAVSVQLQMEPLDDLHKYQAPAMAIAQEIQSRLQQQVFSTQTTPPT